MSLQFSTGRYDRRRHGYFGTFTKRDERWHSGPDRRFRCRRCSTMIEPGVPAATDDALRNTDYWHEACYLEHVREQRIEAVCRWHTFKAEKGVTPARARELERFLDRYRELEHALNGLYFAMRHYNEQTEFMSWGGQPERPTAANELAYIQGRARSILKLALTKYGPDVLPWLKQRIEEYEAEAVDGPENL